MGYPLFNPKELEGKPPGHAGPQGGDNGAAPANPPQASCPVEKAKPTSYLRDLIVMLMILAALGGLAWLAYHLPRWI